MFAAEALATNTSRLNANTTTNATGNTNNNNNSNVVFVEELEEETILDVTHNENVDKLNYIVILCGYLIELAKSRSNPFMNQQSHHHQSQSQSQQLFAQQQQQQQQQQPLAIAAASANATVGLKSLSSQRSLDQFTVADVSVKRAEQLVLYLKCLQLLKPVLSFARDELRASHLKSTLKVRKIVRQLNNMYKLCLYQAKQLYNAESARGSKWHAEKTNLNADKLLYIHAIELCRESAMEEFFGKPQKVFFFNNL